MRYYAAAVQTSLPGLIERADLPARIDALLAMAEGAIVGYEPFHDVRLLVFPEFSHTAPLLGTVAQLRARTAVGIDAVAPAYERFCRARGVFVQTGSFVEVDPRYPGALFNTTLLVGPGGVLARYRKVNPWLPWELSTSPHDIEGYDEPLFPVAETEIGRLGCAICYDWIFPESLRELAMQGAELLLRVSAYMDPWGATPPTDWWTLFNRARAAENTAFVVAANQAAQVPDYPPFSWPGSSMVVDFDGRVLAQAEPGPFQKIVVAPIDLGALRAERARRRGHDMRAHLRTEAYRYLRTPHLARGGAQPLDAAGIEARIAAAKRTLPDAQGT